MPNISILNQEIRTMDGLFSLNDLHKASGANENHRPSKFIRTDQTKALIAEIERENSQSPNMGFQETAIKSVKGGKYAGTYGCHEIIYAYAMWISSAFYLKVIRYFHAGQQAEPQATLDKLSTVETRVPLKDAVNRLVATKKVPYNVAWKMVHQREGVSKANELTEAQVQDALQYVHELTLSNVIEGELLLKDETPKLPELPEGHANIPFNMEKNADYMVRVREGKASRKQLLYCANPQDEKQDWWLEA